jgi:hypothetical protein
MLCNSTEMDLMLCNHVTSVQSNATTIWQKYHVVQVTRFVQGLQSVVGILYAYINDVV